MMSCGYRSDKSDVQLIIVIIRYVCSGQDQGKLFSCALVVDPEFSVNMRCEVKLQYTKADRFFCPPRVLIL